MSGMEKIGRIAFTDNVKGIEGTCELQMIDANGDGIIRDPQNQIHNAMDSMIPEAVAAVPHDVLECNPNDAQMNAFSETFAQIALERMGIHAFPPNILLRKNLQNYTDQINPTQKNPEIPEIPASALKGYVTHMSQAENLSRTYLGDKSLVEIKSNLQKMEQHLETAETFSEAAQANFGERTKFEENVKSRAYTNAAREIGKRAIVIANEAVAIGNPKGPKINEAIQLLREYEEQARNANLSINEISNVSDMVIRLFSILHVDGPI